MFASLVAFAIASQPCPVNGSGCDCGCQQTGQCNCALVRLDDKAFGIERLERRANVCTGPNCGVPAAPSVVGVPQGVYVQRGAPVRTVARRVFTPFRRLAVFRGRCR